MEDEVCVKLVVKAGGLAAKKLLKPATIGIKQ